MRADRRRPWGFERSGPVADLVDMQDEMHRVFDACFGRRSHDGAVGRVWAPAVDIYETRDELIVVAELPGIKDTDVHLSLTGDILSLRGHRVAGHRMPDHRIEEENYHRIERWSGGFERHIQLPMAVQTDRVRAIYRDGVLEIHLPKVEDVKPREIKIEVG